MTELKSSQLQETPKRSASGDVIVSPVTSASCSVTPPSTTLVAQITAANATNYTSGKVGDSTRFDEQSHKSSSTMSGLKKLRKQSGGESA